LSIASVLHLLYTPASGEVQFNCPWCTTRLALPEGDFARERAVLCPRCNNPIDLTVQRRLVQAPPPPAPPARSGPPPVPMTAPARRQVTTPPPARSPPPRDHRQLGGGAPPMAHSEPRSLPPLEKRKQESVALDFDPEKPIDIDGAFKGEPIHVDDIDSLMSKSDLWSMAGPRRSVTGGAGSGKPGAISGVVSCPSCNYENAPVPPGFEFGKVRKCTWCGKPLPP